MIEIINYINLDGIYCLDLVLSYFNNFFDFLWIWLQVFCCQEMFMKGDFFIFVVQFCVVEFYVIQLIFFYEGFYVIIVISIIFFINEYVISY